MDKPSISELEALRAKMTPGPYRQGAVEKYNVFCPCEDALAPQLGRVLFSMNPHFPYADDAAGLVAEHNAMPELLALAKAALELNSAKKAAHKANSAYWDADDAESVNATRAVRDSSEQHLERCLADYAAALQAVRP